MTLLVFGRTGQVACALQAQAENAVFLGRDEADLCHPAACAAAIAAHKPSAVINAAAYTAVDEAEEHRETAMTVNGAAPAAMAETCQTLGIPFVHISTDYVFDGSGTAPWQPDDATSPLGVYGASKLDGERGVAAAGGIYAILRTSWVFSAHGSNFLKTMLRLSETRDHVNVVDDQIGAPTPATAIAAACLTIAQTLISEPNKGGTYHFSSIPETSWAGFAREIFKVAGLSVTVEDIPTSGYPTLAPRPLNSRLDCTSLTDTFGIPQPDWREATHQIVSILR